MEFVLNRQGGGAVRDQLLAQLELHILRGHVAPGARLPSVRSLARRLAIHPNTVSAAYQDLERAGHVRLRRGAGVFVRPAAATSIREARDLDSMIRLALYAAFAQGHRGAEIRAAVERWLSASPPDRILVADPCVEMAELMAFEIHEALGLQVDGISIDALRARPGLAAGALLAALPYHLETLSHIVPGSGVEVLHIDETSTTAALADLPAGATVLFISYSPTVLPFAAVLTRSLRGDEVLPIVQPLAASREWRRTLPVAALVVVDGLSARVVRQAKPRRLREVRLLKPDVFERLREAVVVVAPAPASGTTHR
jgi:DNA-binding transcriptional regulator YhcF (GntR family)